MSKTELMIPKKEVTASRLDGLDVLRDSNGKSSALYFSTYIRINPETNETIITYSISAFIPSSPDYVHNVFDNYNDAVNRYNELLLKFDAYQ